MRGCADPRQSQYDGVCQLYVVENTERFQRARRAGLQCVWKGRGSERLQYGVRGCCFGGLCAAAIGTDTSFFVAGCAAENGAWLAFRARHCADCIAAGQCRAAGAHLCGCGLVYSTMRAEALESLYAPEAGRLRLAVNTFWEETVPEAQKALFRGVLDVFIRTVVHPYQPMQKDAIRCAFRHGLEDYLAGTNAENRMLGQIVAQYGGGFGANAVWDRSAAHGSSIADPAYTRAAFMESLRGFDACLMTEPTNVVHFCGFSSVALRLGADADGVPRGTVLYGAGKKRLFSAALCIKRYTKPVSWP